jgi:hypothetical protein
MKQYAIYYYQGNGRLDFVCITQAETRDAAVEWAQARVAKEYHANICARPWLEPT